MGLDAAVLVVVLAWALLGALRGFARHVGRLLAVGVALVAAGPVGRNLGPTLARAAQTSHGTGVVLATACAFALVYVLMRSLATAVLRRALAGDDDGASGADRWLGAGLGALEAATLAYLGLCAATFLEHTLAIAGRRVTMTPQDSVLASAARRFNLIERVQFSGLVDLRKALAIARAPTAAQRLRGDPDYAALMRDARFRGLLGQMGSARAAADVEAKGLLGDGQAVDLLRDERALKHLARLAQREE